MTAAERHVRELAARAGYRTLRSLARAAEIDRHIVSEWARGLTRPRRAPLLRLADALGVAPYLLERVFSEARSERTARGAA